MASIYDFEPNLFGLVTLAYADEGTAHIIAYGKHMHRKIYHRNGADYILFNNEYIKIIYP